MSYTITDVAKKANVSIATVSRILNNQTGYSEKTKQKVLKVIEELGYEPNAIARGLIRRKTDTIGVLYPSISNFLTSEFLEGIESIAHIKESSVIVTHTQSDGVRTMSYLQMLKEKRVDGLIYISGLLTDEQYEYMKKMDTPIILLSTESLLFPLPYVKVNDYHAAYSAVHYLIKKGHKQIGMLSGNMEDPIAGKPRIEGYKQAMRDHGLNDDERQIVYCKSFNYQAGKDYLIPLKKQFPEMTALFAASDEIAIGAISSAYRHGINIPNDLSIIGYDNLRISEMTIPPLTTVAQPLFDMGAMAAKQLYEMIETSNEVQSIIMPHKIVERESVIEFTG